MKTFGISATLAASLILLSGAGCPRATAVETAEVTASEKTAIANFKTEIEATVKWMEEKQKTPPADPIAGLALMGEMIGKFKAIKTDGLPADLTGAWVEMTGVMGEVGDLFKGIAPEKQGDQEAAMKAIGEILPKLMQVQGKIEPVAKKLDELGKKYGIDLSKVGGK